MQTLFLINNPKHKQYQNAKLEMEFERNQVTLKKLHFFVDDEYFYAPMLLGHNTPFATAWLFQKPYSLTALKTEELEKIALIAKDVLKKYKLSASFEKLISEIPVQAKIYNQIKNIKLDATTRAKLVEEFRSKNAVISDVNDVRYIYYNQFSK